METQGKGMGKAVEKQWARKTEAVSDHGGEFAKACTHSTPRAWAAASTLRWVASAVQSYWPSRRRDCHFAGTPSPSILKHVLN